MKWIQSLLILFLFLGFSIFQLDQIFDIEWLVCENSLSIKSEYNNFCPNKCLWHDFEPITSLFNQIRYVFQLKNPLSVLYSSFQRATPFWRPPPTASTLILSYWPPRKREVSIELPKSIGGILTWIIGHLELQWFS